MSKPTPPEIAHDILEALRLLSKHYGCRLEASSDTQGATGRFCCCASNQDRTQQGFGSDFEEALHNLKTQPVRGSTNRK